jgi:hypothetical protein
VREEPVEDTMTISTTAKPIQVGDIFDSNWGYDQTNTDFYEVVAVTAQRIRVRPIEARTAEGSHRIVPVPGAYTGPAVSRKPHWTGDRWGFYAESYAWASEWDGTPQYDTIAAGDTGH